MRSCAPLTIPFNRVLSYLPEPLYTTTSQHPNRTSVNHCREIIRIRRPWEAARNTTWGQVGQMRGRFKLTKVPPISKLDRSSVSFGGGARGARGRFLKTFSPPKVADSPKLIQPNSIPANPTGIPRSACHERPEVIQFPPSATGTVAGYVKQTDTITRRSFDGRDKNSEFHMGRRPH